MQLFNSGLRKIVLAGQIVEPKALFEVSDKEGKKLMELFAGEVVEPPVVTRDDTAEMLKADLEAVKAERDEAQQMVEDLQAKIDEMKAEIKELKKELKKA